METVTTLNQRPLAASSLAMVVVVWMEDSLDGRWRAFGSFVGIDSECILCDAKRKFYGGYLDDNSSFLSLEVAESEPQLRFMYDSRSKGL